MMHVTMSRNPPSFTFFTATCLVFLSCAMHCVGGLDYAAFVESFTGDCDGAKILMYEGSGDNPGGSDDYQLAYECAKACFDKPFYPLSGSWVDFEATGFAVVPAGNSNAGRCACESQPSSICPRSSNSEFTRYDFTCSPNNPLPCSFGNCTFLRGSKAVDVTRSCGTNNDAPCPALMSSTSHTSATVTEQAALVLDSDASTFAQTACGNSNEWWRLDLEKEISIDRVRILNLMVSGVEAAEGAELTAKLAGAEIRVGNVETYDGNPACATNLPGDYVIDVPCVTSGRYIFVVQPQASMVFDGQEVATCLHLSEINVFTNGGRLSRVGSCLNHPAGSSVLYLNYLGPGKSKGITSVDVGVFQDMTLTFVSYPNPRPITRIPQPSGR